VVAHRQAVQRPAAIDNDKETRVNSYQPGELVFADFFRALRGHLTLLLIATLSGAVSAGVLSFFVTARYDATVVMMAVDSSNLSSALGVSPALSGLIGAGLGLGAKSKEQEAVAVLESRSFAVSFIQQENALPVIFPELWDAQRRTWRTKSGKPPSLNAAFKRFDRNIRTLRRNSETGLVELTIRLPDRILAAQWANKLAARLNDELRARVIAEAQASLRFLDAELERTPVVGVRAAIFKLVESQTKEIMLAKVREQYALRITDPAAPADVDDPAFPKPAVLVALGGLAGALLAVLFVLLYPRQRAAGPDEYVHA
jgi:uncharacterized protein involved in exopolysaccharide biosynthesis